jgi:hypothetical protein
VLWLGPCELAYAVVVAVAPAANVCCAVGLVEGAVAVAVVVKPFAIVPPSIVGAVDTESTALVIVHCALVSVAVRVLAHCDTTSLALDPVDFNCCLVAESEDAGAVRMIIVPHSSV